VKNQLFWTRKLSCNGEVRGNCKEMPVIPVSKVLDKKRIIGKRGLRRRKSGSQGR
jgi:hypothetical protein